MRHCYCNSACKTSSYSAVWCQTLSLSHTHTHTHTHPSDLSDWEGGHTPSFWWFFFRFHWFFYLFHSHLKHFLFFFPSDFISFISATPTTSPQTQRRPDPHSPQEILHLQIFSSLTHSHYLWLSRLTHMTCMGMCVCVCVCVSAGLVLWLHLPSMRAKHKQPCYIC